MTKTTEKRLVQMPAVEHIKSIKQNYVKPKVSMSTTPVPLSRLLHTPFINYLKKKNCQLWQYQHYKICLIQN